MPGCFPTIVWDIADRPEWSTRLVGRHGAWQAPGPRGCCSSLLAPGRGLETIAEPHHRLWLETGWAARLPYVIPASCGGGAFRWPGPAASGVRPTRTVIGFWGWDGQEAQPALGPLAVTETGALWSPALRLLFSQHPEYLTPPLTPTPKPHPNPNPSPNPNANPNSNPNPSPILTMATLLSKVPRASSVRLAPR